MKRIITSSLVAASIALTSIPATPVQAAQIEDVGKVAFGAIALFTLINILDGKNKNDTKYKTPVIKPNPPKKSTKNPKPPKKAKKKPNYPQLLPTKCFFKVKTPHGYKGYYGQKCLKETTGRHNELPQYCLKNIPIKYGRRANVYDSECLYYRGFHVADRR